MGRQVSGTAHLFASALTCGDFRFKRPIFHPNVYDDGRLCISILHAPGEDVMSGENAGERWSPAQRVESVLISILSLLDDPEIFSPANIEASNMYRDDKKMFKERVKENVERSKADMPEGFVMPRHEIAKPVVEKIEDDFWADSDAEDTFGGSDSDAEMTMDDDFDEDDVEEEHDHEDDQD
jgi:ubiquitin-conjugating enzyme E2 R